MNWIDVIGAGPGDESLLTFDARAAIDGADAVWCAERHMALVPADKRRPLSPFGAAMDAIEQARAAGEKTAVLLSGDTGLYSMLPLLAKRFGRDALRVHPGVRSLQAFCARLGETWQNATILSAHGRELSPEALCFHARTNARTLLLLDAERNPRWVRAALDAGGLEALSLIVGERVSYGDETIAPFEDRDYDPLSVAMIENPAPEKGLPPVGLSDDAFIRAKTPMTKREIRAQVISSLRLAPDSVVWDVGAGTGSVTVECARQCPLGQVYAVERDEDALSLIRQNIARFHRQNVALAPGSAPDALHGLPTPTHVFLGGTGGETRDILALIEALRAPVRVCATAVTMETTAFLTEALANYEHFEAAQIAVSRLEKVGRYRMLRAQNPVFVFLADILPKEEEA